MNFRIEVVSQTRVVDEEHVSGRSTWPRDFASNRPFRMGRFGDLMEP